MEVAVAEFPVGETVALHRLHLHIGRQQIIATVRTMAGGLFHEHFGVITLAGQTSVMVGERDDDGFDLFLRNHFAQTAETQRPSCFALALTQIFPRKIPGRASLPACLASINTRVMETRHAGSDAYPGTIFIVSGRLYAPPPMTSISTAVAPQIHPKAQQEKHPPRLIFPRASYQAD